MSKQVKRAAPVAALMPPERDPGGQWGRAIKALAREHGCDVLHLLEEFEHRAAIREYLGEASRDVANAAAFDDVRDRLDRRRGAA